MKHFIFLALLATILTAPATVPAAPDIYIGDTAIYGAPTATLKPNVLIVFDSSGSMTGTVNMQVCSPAPDQDNDGVADADDSCPAVPNPGAAQTTDIDGDGIADACDDNIAPPDADGDGITDADDNCPFAANAGQADTDGDGIGDVCEPVSAAYDPSVNYTSNVTAQFCGEGSPGSWQPAVCDRDAVYQCVSGWDGLTCDNWRKEINDVNDISCADPQDALKNNGHWQGRKNLANDCQDTWESQSYQTGNYITWYNLSSAGASLEYPSVENLAATTASEVNDAATTADTSALLNCETVTESKNQIARNVIRDLIQTTDGVNFGVMRFDPSHDYPIPDYEGGRFITRNVSGADYTSYIDDMEEIHTGTTTKKDALLEIVANIPASGATPLGESLFEAMRYLSGSNSAFVDGLSYNTPIEASCQQNYVIVITDGMATSDDNDVLRSICTSGTSGDCDGDSDTAGSQGYLDDVAKYLHDTDLSPDADGGYNGVQNAYTFTIGFGDLGGDQAAVELLNSAAANGGGEAYLASDYASLSTALTAILNQILEVNSAFVAPVVPTSPENKTYSGKRVYTGFFKPIINADWRGNLKKFGLSADGNILDKTGAAATDANGRFKPTSTSYWSTSADGFNVEEGGVGELLRDRDLSNDQRAIYTYTGTNSSLTHSSNEFTTGNGQLTAALLQVQDAADKNNIINYVHGFDAYGSDPTLQREWILGDILHSKPAIQTYQKYLLAEETDINKNKTMIYVGSNDGMLHAFRDADGNELWSFIPPAALPNLQYLDNTNHEYFMDGSPVLYVYDHDQDGNIGPGPETAAGDVDPANITDNGTDDKVIMLVGMRRGGGLDNLHPTSPRGFYYALDVTNPEQPKYLWSIDSTTVDGNGNVMFGELGETWSDPKLGVIRLNGTDKLVAFIGAGYDNNEDLRFGDTQTFPTTTTDTTSTSLSTADSGDVTSTGDVTQVNPKGRGVYVIQLANLSSSGQPTVATSPTKIWEWVYTAALENSDPTNNPTFSFPSSVSTLDSDFDGYIDLFYIGDTGGNMWRFDIHGKANTNAWTGTKIFSANPSDQLISEENPVTNGRKIFYAPSLVVEPKYIGVYFGAGDRPHPLNEGTIDRLYAIYDRNIFAYKYPSTPLPRVTETKLVNLTEDMLQAANPVAPPADLNNCTATDKSIACTLQRLYSEDYYGWFIKLDLEDGEKSLANPLVFNKVAYFTTYTPNPVTNDPCETGNLGIGRTYAVNYKTGEAVFNFDLTNDSEYASNTNERAETGQTGVVLRRSDRFKKIGPGIPSGIVVLINEDGTSSTLVGCGGGLCTGETKDGGTTIPIYWLRE